MPHEPVLVGAAGLRRQQGSIDYGLRLNVGRGQPMRGNVPRWPAVSPMSGSAQAARRDTTDCSSQVGEVKAGERTSASAIEHMHVLPEQRVFLCKIHRTQFTFSSWEEGADCDQ